MASPNALAIQSGLTGTTYGLVHLNLAAIAYTDPTTATGDVAAFQAALAACPAIPLPLPTDNSLIPITPPPGAFQLVWGPQVDSIDANLAYMAVYVSEGEAIFGVLGLRGTDIGVKDKAGLAKQIYEDLDIGTLVMATVIDPKAPEGALIAQGSINGHNALCALTSPLLPVTTSPQFTPELNTPLNLQTAIQTLFGTGGMWPGLPLVVTGHSLGGCQTTVMAMQLNAWDLGMPVIPHPFAPTTAGNQPFATWYGDTFPNGILWANPNDIVPYAFSNMPYIKNELWGSLAWAPGPNGYGPTFPEGLENAVIDAAFGSLAAQATSGSYTQPTAGWIWLDSAMPAEANITKVLANMNMASESATSWLAMLIWQHFPPSYSLLLPAVAGVMPYLGPIEQQGWQPNL